MLGTDSAKVLLIWMIDRREEFLNDRTLLYLPLRGVLLGSVISIYWLGFISHSDCIILLDTLIAEAMREILRLILLILIY